jgi:hypothetical protein
MRRWRVVKNEKMESGEECIGEGRELWREREW